MQEISKLCAFITNYYEISNNFYVAHEFACTKFKLADRYYLVIHNICQSNEHALLLLILILTIYLPRVFFMENTLLAIIFAIVLAQVN